MTARRGPSPHESFSRRTRRSHVAPNAQTRKPAPHRPDSPPRRHYSYKWKRLRLLIFPAVFLLIFALLRSPSNSQISSPEVPPSPTTSISGNQTAATPLKIPTSRPIEMQIPALNMSAEFEENDCRVKDGAINPDTLNLACTYTSTDRPYSLPGTDSTDVVVIAGHTGAVVPAVFNKLYDGRANKHRIALGDKLYIRTDKSANFWLEYTATDLHEPEKAGLSQSADIWGTTATPGRLLTISCIQPANPLANSVKNAVVGWQFSQVTSEPTTS